MSWRPSNNSNYRPSSSYSSRRDERAGASTFPMIYLIIGAAVLVLVVVGVIIAINVAGSQGGAPAAPAAAQPAAAQPAATQPAAATASPAPTTASAPVIVSSRATATPAPTVGPADAGPVDNSGDAEAGKALFNAMPSEALLAGAVTCATCHLIDDTGATMVGPNLQGVATRAETRTPILSPAQYLRTSIRVPDSYVVETFIPGTMTQTFAKALTPEQIEDLVAYLLTLK